MSMAGLLAKFGHDAGRWVGPTGRVTIGSGAGGAGGLRVAPHTFHGGEDPRGDIADDSEAPWWLSDGAMTHEREVMAQAFPSFLEVPGDDANPPAWFGSIDTGRGVFQLMLVHRNDHGLPSVVPLRITRRGKPRGRGWANAPHLYTSGNLCVADTADWAPDRMTIADVVAWAAHWHACYVEWLATDRWPADGVPDVAA